MRFTLGKFTAAVVVLVALLGASIASAQCLTCTNPFGGHCVTVSSGFGSCTDYPGSGDVTCKLSCPNCPSVPCDGGGGGGGECIIYTGDMGSAVAMGYTTATVGLIFKTDAATNAHLFGGRGQGYRVVPGSVSGDVDASAVRQTVQNLIGGAANLNVAFAFSNFNEAGIPIQFVSGTEGFALAPSTNGMSSTIKFRVQNANKLERAMNQATLQSSDLLLIDIKARGQVYVMAINIQSLNRSAGDFGSRIERIQELLRQTSAPYTGIDPMVFKMPDC